MKRIVLIITILFAGISFSMSQNRIKGTVISGENGEPLPGATVTITGTTISVVTDLNGQYSIEVPDGYKTLTVSYEGMEPAVLNISPDPIVLTPKGSGLVMWGIRLGINAAKLSGNEKSGLDDYKGRIGFHLGVAVNYEFKASMSLESGLYLTTKGTKYDEDGIKDKFNVVYLQIPVLYNYQCDLGNDISLQGKIGPYFALGLSAKNKWEIEDEGSETLKGFGKGDEDDPKTGLKRGDAGVMLGVGISKGNYYLGLNYERGLVNINAYDEGKVHTRNFSVSLGYNF